MFSWFDHRKIQPALVEFESAYGLAESVDRLKTVTRRSIFSAMVTEAAVGTVKESGVSLQRVVPLFRNSFKPCFRGRFVERNGRVFLVGSFGLHWAVKVFMSVWFGTLLVFIVLSTAAAVRGQHNAASVPLFSIGMMAFGIGLVWVGRRMSRADPAWLSAMIRLALQTAQSNATNHQQPIRSNTTTIAAIFLFAVGLLSLGSAFTGIQSAITSAHGPIVTHYPNPGARYFPAAIGFGLSVLAYGVFRRKLVAWRGGLVVIAASWIYSVARIFSQGDLPKTGPYPAFFILASLAVTIISGRWWFGQRVHFNG